MAVAEELSFTRAAQRLHIAQPPLSTQIKALEEEVGAPLFIRDTRRVFLTQAGHEFLLHARVILADVQNSIDKAREASRGVVGRVVLGYTASAMFTERLPRVLRKFRTEQPHIAVALHEMGSLDQIVALQERELDIGILRRPDPRAPEDVDIERWYEAPLTAAVPSGHPLAHRRSLKISDLRGEALITYPRNAGIGLYWPVIQLCAKAGFRPNVVREALEPAVMIGLVSAGIGIALVPWDTRCIQLEGVAYVKMNEPEAVSTLWLAHREGETDTHIRTMLIALRREALAPIHSPLLRNSSL